MSRDPLRPGFLTCELWGFVLLAVVLMLGFPRDPGAAAQFVMAYLGLCGGYGILSGGRSLVKAKAAGKSDLLEGNLRGTVEVTSEP